jgi:hypothetical protein
VSASLWSQGAQTLVREIPDPCSLFVRRQHSVRGKAPMEPKRGVATGNPKSLELSAFHAAAIHEMAHAVRCDSDYRVAIGAARTAYHYLHALDSEVGIG